MTRLRGPLPSTSRASILDERLSYTRITMTRVGICLVQYDPKLGDVDGNMQRVDHMLGGLTSELVDILLLPEMAFTGYMFSGREEIASVLEDKDGPSISWARKTARKLQAAVLVGFPEIDRSTKQAYNSIAVIDYHGTLQVWLSYPVLHRNRRTDTGSLCSDNIQKTLSV